MSFEQVEEVVADSEDENYSYLTSNISGFTNAQDTVAADAGTTDNISYFTTENASKSTETSISSFAPNTANSRSSARPRPRPAYKGAAAVANAISAITDPPSISIGPSSRAPAAADSSGELNRDVHMGSSNPSFDISSQPTSTFSLDIAERAKMRSRKVNKPAPPISFMSTPSPIDKPRPKPKRGLTTRKRLSPAPEVINLTSDDDDELALAPIKPQTPLREKSNLSGSRTSKPGTIKPLEASSPTPQPPQILDNEHDHPPIVFLPNDTEVDIFPSSSPLFSPTQPKQTKRKRLEVLNFGREDDAQDDMVLDTNAQTMPPPPRMFASSSSALPPPPTFFAPSSPSVNDSGIDMDISVPEPSKSSVKKPTGRKKPPATEGAKKGGKTHNIDDDDFNLETERPQKKKKPEPKAKKSRNRHGDLEKVAIQTPKSKEFVVDDDEDLGNGSVSVPATDRHPIDTRSVKLIAPAAEPESALSSVPDSDIDIVPKKRGTKRKPTTKSGAQSKKKGGKGKGKLVVLSGDENDADADADVDDIEAERPVVLSDPDQAINAKGKEREDKPKDVDESNEGEGADNGVKLLKENLCPVPQTTGPLESLSEQVPPPSKAASRSYSIASRTKSTPMSELIRRVNSLPGSPFSTTPHRGPVTPNSTAYSPYLKSSRSTLSRIASLHPNRRTPPPPLPKPPPPKKTKKQLEQEEKWEEELQESVEGWATLTDEERAAMRRAKRAMAEGWDD